MGAKSQGKYKVTLSGGSRTLSFNRFLHVPNFPHNSDSVSSLCKHRHTVLFTKRKCVIESKSMIVGAGKHTRGPYAVELNQQTNDHALPAWKKDNDMLDELHANSYPLTVAPSSAQSGKGAILDMDMKKRLVLLHCPPCIQDRMENTSTKTRTHEETRYG